MTKRKQQIPYTYLIGWSHLNIWYYGSKTGKDAAPDTFWKTYFTSSKHVKNFRKEHGEPDVIEVRKTFSCPLKAREWEHKTLWRLKVVPDSKWLNKSYGNGKFHTSGMTNIVTPEGNIITVPTDHPMIIAGEYINVNGNKKWYNDGIICKKFKIGTQPCGWTEGDLRKPFNNGKTVKYLVPGTEPVGWQRGDLQHLLPITVFYNNGVTQVRSIEGEEPEGFVRGCLPKDAPMKWYNNGTDSYQYNIDKQPEGWIVGRIISQDEKDKRPYNNGEVEKKFIPGTEPEGFVRGRLPKNKTPAAGTKRYNNGTINKGFIPGTEPAGWVLGEIPRKSGTKKYYNNGIEQKGFVPGTEPDGWVLGGLPKVYLHGKRWYNHGNEESKFIPGTEPEGWLLGRKDSAK